MDDKRNSFAALQGDLREDGQRAFVVPVQDRLKSIQNAPVHLLALRWRDVLLIGILVY